MSLTIGTGPFGPKSPRAFNFDASAIPARTLLLEGSPKRVRILFNGETIADSGSVKMLHETEHLPVYYFPWDDVSREWLVPTDHLTTCSLKGAARYWTVRVGDRAAENAVWNYADPIDGCPLPPDHVAFDWDAMDAWYEESEEVFVHPRDPYHRIDVLRSSRRVRVIVGGEVVAQTNRPRLLLETGLPVRYYIPEEDVQRKHLRPSEKETHCPYKGEARFHSVEAGGRIEHDLAWFYPRPSRDAVGVEGCLCFFNERVDLEVDGERQPRPTTRWS